MSMDSDNQAHLRVVTADDDLITEGREILDRITAANRDKDAASWDFADWAARPEVAEIPVRELAEALGTSTGKISDYRAVSMAWPLFKRLNSLTFSHHLAAARAPEDARAVILAQAAENGWTVAETQAAARDASLEGEVSRLEAENRALKKSLAAERAESREAINRIREHLSAAVNICRQEAKRSAALVEEEVTDELTAGLHGNGRRGLAGKLRKAAARLTDGAESQARRINAVADRVEGRDTRLSSAASALQREAERIAALVEEEATAQFAERMPEVSNLAKATQLRRLNDSIAADIKTELEDRIDAAADRLESGEPT